MSNFDSIMGDQFRPGAFEMPASVEEVATAAAVFDITTAVMAELNENGELQPGDPEAAAFTFTPWSRLVLTTSPRSLALMLRRIAQRLGHEL